MIAPGSRAGVPGGDTAAVHLVGVGPGAVDLLTVRASRLIAMSGTCLYAHRVVPREALSLCPPTARVVDTTPLTDEQLVGEIVAANARGDRVVHLFAGDPHQHPGTASLVAALDTRDLPWEIVPGIPHPDFAVTSAGQRADGSAGPTAGPGAGPDAGTGPGRILVLGGTAEARALADLLVSAGLEVVTSLAGRVSRPRLPRGEVRIGEFRDPDELADWLAANAVGAVIDATDPFSTRISADAVPACAVTGVPLLRLERPRWSATGGDEWIRVPDMLSAVDVVRERFRRPMLTVGKLGATAFADDSKNSYLIRCSEPPPGRLPQRYLLVLDRGPFGVDSERTLMSRHRIDVLVTRDSGGEATTAKLEAARELRIPVVMVDRPIDVGGVDGTAPETVRSVDEAARWLVSRFGSR